MSIKRVVLLYLLALSVAGWAAGGWGADEAADEAIDQDLVQQVFEVSGLKPVLAQIPQLIGAAAAEAPNFKFLGEAERRKLLSPINEAFNSAELTRQALQLIADRYHAARFARFVAAYRAPIVTQMQKIELAALEPDLSEKVARFAATLEQQPPAEDRIQLLMALDDLTGASEVKGMGNRARASCLDAILAPKMHREAEGWQPSDSCSRSTPRAGRSHDRVRGGRRLPWSGCGSSWS